MKFFFLIALTVKTSEDNRSGSGLRFCDSHSLACRRNRKRRIAQIAGLTPVTASYADKFPALRRSGRKYLTFRVLSKETQQMERWRWNDVYTCELIKVTE